MRLGGNENPKPEALAASCKAYSTVAHKNITAAKRVIEKTAKHETVAGREADTEQASIFSSLAIINGFSALVLTFERTGQPHNKAVQSAYEVLNRHHAAIKAGAESDALEALQVNDLFGWEATPQKDGGNNDGK